MIDPSPPAEYRHRGEGDSATFCVTSPEGPAEVAGDPLTVAALTPELYEQTMARWDERAANTWNKHLSALTSFTAYCRRQDWLATDPRPAPGTPQGHPDPATSACSASGKSWAG